MDTVNSTLKPTEPTVCGGCYSQACHQAQCTFVGICRDKVAVWKGYFPEKIKT